MQFGFVSLGENSYPGVDRDDRAYYSEYMKVAELVDELDFTSFWTGEHHFNHVASVSSPIMLLGAIAARTKRMRLGTAVNVLSFHHPIRYAEDYATLDQISNGRAVVGGGVGYALGEFRGFQRDITEARERFREVMMSTEKALHTGKFGFKGKYYDVPEENLVPKPVQEKLEMCMAVFGSMSSLEWAAERGYNIFTSSQSQTLLGDALPGVIKRYRSLGDSHGHKKLKVYVPFFMLCSEDDAQIQDEFHKMVGYWKHLSGDLDKGLPDDLKYWETMKAKFEVLTVDDLKMRQTAFGRPEMLIKLFLAIAETGVDEVCVEPYYGPQNYEDVEANIKLFREKVMPYVDHRFGGPKYEWNGSEVVKTQEATNVLD